MLGASTGAACCVEYGEGQWVGPWITMISSASPTVEDHWECLSTPADWPFRRHRGELFARPACVPYIVRCRPELCEWEMGELVAPWRRRRAWCRDSCEDIGVRRDTVCSHPAPNTEHISGRRPSRSSSRFAYTRRIVPAVDRMRCIRSIQNRVRIAPKCSSRCACAMSRTASPEMRRLRLHG